jgi:hypothetical protein
MTALATAGQASAIHRATAAGRLPAFAGTRLARALALAGASPVEPATATPPLTERTGPSSAPGDRTPALEHAVVPLGTGSPTIRPATKPKPVTTARATVPAPTPTPRTVTKRAAVISTAAATAAAASRGGATTSLVSRSARPFTGKVTRLAGMPAPEQGVASTYGPGYAGYIAVPRHGRWLVRIIWHGRYVVRATNDYGPDRRLFPDRVIDLDVATFQALSGQSWTRGILAPVTVVYLEYLGA